MTEFLMLEYADSDKLYVPVHSLHLISRYTGASPEQAPLHRPGLGPVAQGQAQGGEAGARYGRGTAGTLRQAGCAARGCVRLDR